MDGMKTWYQLQDFIKDVKYYYYINAKKYKISVITIECYAIMYKK